MDDMRELLEGQSGSASGGKTEKKLTTVAPTTDLPA
jgi:hypothetical protein